MEVYRYLSSILRRLAGRRQGLLASRGAILLTCRCRESSGNVPPCASVDLIYLDVVRTRVQIAHMPSALKLALKSVKS